MKKRFLHTLLCLALGQIIAVCQFGAILLSDPVVTFTGALYLVWPRWFVAIVAKWRRGASWVGSPLVHAKACRLTAPTSYYQNRCWIVIDEAHWNLSEDPFFENIANNFYFEVFKKCLKIRLHHFGSHEFIYHCRRSPWSRSQRFSLNIVHSHVAMYTTNTWFVCLHWNSIEFDHEIP